MPSAYTTKITHLPIRPRTTFAPTAALRAEIIPVGLHPQLFPAGKEARHVEHGWVYVECAEANQRKIVWYDFREIPREEWEDEVDPQGDPYLQQMELTPHWAWVGVNELRRVNPRMRPEKWQRVARWGWLDAPGPKVRAYHLVERYERPADAPPLPAHWLRAPGREGGQS